MGVRDFWLRLVDVGASPFSLSRFPFRCLLIPLLSRVPLSFCLSPFFFIFLNLCLLFLVSGLSPAHFPYPFLSLILPFLLLSLPARPTISSAFPLSPSHSSHFLASYVPRPPLSPSSSAPLKVPIFILIFNLSPAKGTAQEKHHQQWKNGRSPG